jgi:hypothetical protein
MDHIERIKKESIKNESNILYYIYISCNNSKIYLNFD